MPHRPHGAQEREPQGRLALPVPRREKASERTARSILRQMTREKLPWGAALPPEPIMLEKYRVARGTLREALRLLEFSGLVKLRRGAGGGPVVTEPSALELGRFLTLHFERLGVSYEDLHSARSHLDPLVARLAAEERSDSDAERLARFMEQMRTPAESAESTGALDFHSFVISLVRNPIVRHLNDALMTIGYPFDVPSTRAFRESAVTDHLAIGRAILKGDGAAAERRMRRHWDAILAHSGVPARDWHQSIEWAGDDSA